MKKLISICLLLTAIPALADDVGKVLFTAKDVLLMRGGSQNKLGRGDSLQAGDTIVTAAASSAKIKYFNGTLVTVGELSKYKILAYSPKQGDVELAAELTSGKMESQTTGKKKQKEELKTPMVVMRIFGTKYKVFVPDAKTTNTMVESGEVKVGNMTLIAGQSSLSTPAGTLAAPFPASGNISKSETTQNGSETGAAGASHDNGGSEAGVSGASLSSLIGTTVVVSSATSGTEAASVIVGNALSIAPFVITSCGG